MSQSLDLTFRELLGFARHCLHIDSETLDRASHGYARMGQRALVCIIERELLKRFIRETY